jgi:D-3-phosphoglycerate dehydrogenase
MDMASGVSATPSTCVFRVLVTDFAWPSLDIEREMLAGVGGEVVVATTGDEAELIELAPHADAILTNWKQVPEAAVQAALRCLVISRYGVGVDNIPVALATSLGIVVTNAPDFCVNEVADQAMALLLACARRIVPFASDTRQGVWSLNRARGLPRLRGQTLGIVGFGRIARAVVARARGFGLRVVAYTPRLDAAALGELADQVEIASGLDELLVAADYVSLHAPATAETAGMIGEPQLRQMKSTAYLINTSRGALIDQESLARALAQGEIAGAALDVLTPEPPPADLALLSSPNVIVTPHAGFYSDVAIQELQTDAVANVVSVLSGTVPENVVNRAVLEAGGLRMRLAPAPAHARS